MHWKWKDLFYFTKGQKIGVLVIASILFGVVIGRWIFSPDLPPPLDVTEGVLRAENPPSGRPQTPAQAPYVPYYASRKESQRQTPPEQRTYYRQEKPEDTPPKTGEAYQKPTEAYQKPASRYGGPEKFTGDTVIELNQADTLTLMRIPGIGRAYAKRITGYRRLLGGYYRIEQLQEVYDMYEELYERIIPYLTIDTELITPISVNSASLDRLKAHPYINFFQAKALVETRRKRGQLSGIEELQLLEEFEADDWARLGPYLDFQNGRSASASEGGGGKSGME